MNHEDEANSEFSERMLQHYVVNETMSIFALLLMCVKLTSMYNKGRCNHSICTRNAIETVQERRKKEKKNTWLAG